MPIRAVPVRSETRIAFHVHDLGGDQEFRFNLPGAEMSAREVDEFMSVLRDETGRGDYVVGSGSPRLYKPRL